MFTRGATVVIIHPFFLLPGRHWSIDIPRMAAEASEQCNNTRYLVTAPLSAHPLIAAIMQSRIDTCIVAANGGGSACDVCVKGELTQGLFGNADESGSFACRGSFKMCVLSQRRGSAHRGLVRYGHFFSMICAPCSSYSRLLTHSC
jgi:hypothetical protein